MTEVIVHRGSPRYVATRIVWTALSIIEAILWLQFLLRLLAANPASGFTEFIYSLARPLLVPFFNIVPNSVITATGGMITWTTLIAIIIYWLAAAAIIQLFFISSTTDHVDYVD